MGLENKVERIDYPTSACCEVLTSSSEACSAGQGQRQAAGQEGTLDQIVCTPPALPWLQAMRGFMSVIHSSP